MSSSKSQRNIPNFKGAGQSRCTNGPAANASNMTTRLHHGTKVEHPKNGEGAGQQHFESKRDMHKQLI